MNGKIYHICEDEKFINSAVEQFESSLPERNFFYVLTENSTAELKHINTSKLVTKIDSDKLLQLPLSFGDDVIIVLHSLSPKFYEFVLQLPLSIKIIWLCFGFEVYNDSTYFKTKRLLDIVTRKKFPEPRSKFKKKFKIFFRPYFRLIKPSLSYNTKELKHKVFDRIDYFGCPFQEEYESVKKMISIEKPFFNFWYYPLELITTIDNSISYPKTKILIGNSGYKTGNHLDVFHKIKDYALDKKAIILPLNYGNPDYINFILKEGSEVLGNDFMPLLDFMPLQEYNTILESVGVAILNNKRQQAVGNTIALLWFGAKVFLSDRNPFYHYLKRMGIEIYCYETELNAKSIIEFSSLESIEKNRKLLYAELNRNHLSNLLKNQILKINE